MRKHSKFDGDMINNRNDYFKNASIDAKFAIDNYALFAGKVPLSKLFARWEVLKRVFDVPGHLLEFGTFNGAGLLLMAKVAELLAPNDMRKVFGFDSFEGLTQFSTQDGEQVKGSYKGNESILVDMINLHELEDKTSLVKGYISDTLPVFLEENPHYIFSYIYIDTDLYESTKTILGLCWDRLSPGGIIAFDEGYDDLYPGEGAALQDFLKESKISNYKFNSFPWARQPMMYLTKG